MNRTLALLLLTFSLAGCDSATGPSGVSALEVVDMLVGSGAEATAGKALTVHYTGWLYDRNAPQNKGTIFDSSAGRGAYPFTLGRGDVIDGWDQGIPGMRVGGKRRLTIPPDLAYGKDGYGPIPPNSSLIFEVELVSVS
jgi:FKBP-type peptidyl-prolyl cis-trans isomerase FkpA